MYRDHLHSVMGDLNFLDEEGRRRDPATATFTEPSVTPPRSERSYTLISDEVGEAHFNAGLGQHWHNGDFGGRYGDELRLMVEGYVRHDPRWAATGCENERVRAVIEPLLGDDFRVVYTDGALDFPGASALGWHADGPTLSFNGRIVDASPRITSLWMLSDFTAENGGTYVVPRSHTLRLEGRGGCDSWSEEERTSIPPQAVPAIGQAGDVLIFHCALDHSAGPNESDGVRSFVQVRYGASWFADPCRKNHSGESGRGGELPEEVLAQMPESTRVRFKTWV